MNNCYFNGNYMSYGSGGLSVKSSSNFGKKFVH
jgi:hypothetical protein